MASALVDTNVLVYRFDHRDRRKQKTAQRVLREGLTEGTLYVAHQSVIEFFAAVTRSIRGGSPLLSALDATRETEELLEQFPVLYPTELTIRAALRAAAAYQMSWFDAGILAYAELNGLSTILSEDFQQGKRYGPVQVTNPILSF